MPRTLSKARALGYDKVLRKAQGQGPAPLQVPLEPEAASAFRHSNAIVTGYRVLLETREGRREHGRLYDRRFQDVDAGGPYSRGTIRPDLSMLAITLKDNMTTSDYPTTCASNILRGWQPRRRSQVARILQQKQAKVVGKTNMDEFGMGSHSTHSAFGPVKNGYGISATSVGGSSGGSAVSVAGMFSNVSIGTDTGGSIRLPAAYMGLVGFKPSYGMISRRGIVPYANSLDTVGILATNTLDLFRVFRNLNQVDYEDPTCLPATTRHRIRDIILTHHMKMSGVGEGETGQRASSAPKGRTRLGMKSQPRTFTYPYSPKYRIGLPIEYNIEELHYLVRKAWMHAVSILEASGHEIVPISLPSTKAALSAYYVLAPAEASSNLAKYDGVRYGPPSSQPPDLNVDDIGSNTPPPSEERLYASHRGAHFGPEVKRRILLGTFSLSSTARDNYFIQAQKVRRLVQQDFDLVFRMKNPLHDRTPPNPKGVDFILCPTAPTPPPLLTHVERQDPVDTYTNDVFTVPASLAGLPAISIPMLPEVGAKWQSETMAGMQIIGQYGADEQVIKFARREFEERENWRKIPRLRERQRFR